MTVLYNQGALEMFSEQKNFPMSLLFNKLGHSVMPEILINGFSIVSLPSKGTNLFGNPTIPKSILTIYFYYFTNCKIFKFSTLLLLQIFILNLVTSS